MKDYVEDLYEKIKGESTSLGKLLEKIPGLRGYMERGRRREADQLLRETIAASLEQSRLNLSGVHRELSRDIVLAMDYAEELGSADTKLMGLIGKIKDAPQGYAGFFDAVKVKEEDLARIYAFDESMLNHVDAINESIDALSTAVTTGGDIDATLRRLNTVLAMANEDWAGRDNVIKGIE